MVRHRRSVPTMGPLEQRAMEILWTHEDRWLHVRDVAAELDADLAYTTVMTLLVRLAGKGLLKRRREGRGYAYRAAISRIDYTARAMAQALGDGANVPDVLFRFVGELSAEEQAALRAALSR